MDFKYKSVTVLLLLTLFSLRTTDGDGLRLPDQVPGNNAQYQQFAQQQQQGPQPVQGEGRFLNNDLLNLVGLGTGPNVDPYVARTNTNCLSGDFSECFKTHALTQFDDFFGREWYQMTDHVRVVRMPEVQLRSLHQEPYEYSSEPRSTDSEWDQLFKFAMRKIERFVKSAGLQIQIPDVLTDNGRYSPRFIDDINDEIDVIEDKKAPLFTRHKLKKLFIPLLLVLKIFKLKLLLFLPFILGLAGVKKLLGLAALIIPGVIAYFKFCKPQHYGGNHYTSAFQQYSPQGLGGASYHNEHQYSQASPFYRQEPSFAKPYAEYYSKAAGGSDNSIRFGDSAQNLAYQGYSEYRNNNKEIS